ncbi:expressed unknown protein [Seminavis robusta]|uniref:Uncharacterized protein n=1 Tax=Seminavis robusta TaxID=568900 RepID=A0A9N8HGJ6_9STRA|nr:expressed unknown protein [Seminavis robusta]|eukprot:Sro581_g170370.1 n/a (345) ;mRNA; f:46891-47925
MKISGWPLPSSLWLFVLFSAAAVVEAAKFSVNGPVVTLTLKDPQDTTTEASSTDEFSTTTAVKTPSTWIDVGSLHPNLYWTLQSNAPPLPNWLPFWKSLRANVGYKYEDLKRLPSFVEADLKFRSERLNAELQVQPSYEIKAKRTNLLVQASRGTSFLLARFSVHQKMKKLRDDDIEWEVSESTTTPSSTSHHSPSLEFLRASYNMQFPASASISNLRITPSLDVTKMEPSCVLEGVTGRSKAILKLNYQNPTLAVVHAIDERNTISPEISLYNARILYQWQVQLGPGSSLRTRVDPTSAIDVTWTDTSATDGGRWVTDLRLPLEGTTIRALASDLRVRRQFNF